ncbi:MAG: hypothetical protein ACR2G2_10640 [Pseudonocardia sp.]
MLATFDLLWQLGRLGSLVLGGLAADALGIQAVYYLGGALLLLAGAIGWHGLLTRPAGAHTQRTGARCHEIGQSEIRVWMESAMRGRGFPVGE